MKDVIGRAREAAYEAFPFRDAYTDVDLEPSADAAMRVLLEHLRGRYFDEGLEDVPMIDFIEPLLAVLQDESRNSRNREET